VLLNCVFWFAFIRTGLFSGGKRLIKIGESMSLPYSREIVVKRWNGRRRKKENVLVNFGFREIQLEERWNPYTRRLEALELTLLVFEGVYKQGERSYFITSERIENRNREALGM
jgi:hypothetical protein